MNHVFIAFADIKDAEMAQDVVPVRDDKGKRASSQSPGHSVAADDDEGDTSSHLVLDHLAGQSQRLPNWETSSGSVVTPAEQLTTTPSQQWAPTG